MIGRGSRSNDELSITRPRRKKTNPWYFAVSAIIAVLVIGSFALAGTNFGGAGGGGRPSLGSSDSYKEGIGIAQQVMENTYPSPHVPDGQTVDYSTVPSTSGKHWNAWAQCDFYDEGLPDERITHNLEHGNIVVSYNFTDPADVTRLRQVLEDTDFYAVWGLARFYDKIPEGQVALATWGVLDTMEGIDPGRIEDFFKTYSGQLGPETVDCRVAPHRMGQ